MERAKRLFTRQPSYERLEEDSQAPFLDETSRQIRQDRSPRFSVTIYAIFLMLGVAMLWAWNMFIAAAPYFQRRFRTSKAILNNFQATELSVSTVANLGSVFVLAKLQSGASYPRRIISSLLINTVTFTLLAISTRAFLATTAAGYLGFVIIMVMATSLATGFMQNGAFAYVADFQRPEYMQAIMLGQAVAGVLPPIVQIGSVLSAGESQDAGQDSSTSAFAYFLTATSVSAMTLLAFFYLQTFRRPHPVTDVAQEGLSEDEHVESDPLHASQADQINAKPSVPLLYLARRLFFSAAAVFLTFGITMVFPVFTQEIFTTNPDPPPLLRDASFIPLGLLVWNMGDLIGRMLPLSPKLSLAHRPRILFLLSVARIVFVPLYLLCNIVPAESSPEAALSVTEQVSKAMPDVFYLLVVQLPFGVSNGYVGSCCMMGAGAFVEDNEREAAGGFMGLVLVTGLAVGSFCSFFVGNG